ncbi:MAG: PHP domain-containing protein, partial [Flavobacteriaceae bacterium]|nr:PHP domain-containing protein [Flavobacteriaceae bacterium]
MLLNTHTYYSLRYGTFSEETLLQLSQENGYTELVLTDINNTSAGLNFVRLAPKYGIRPLLGVDFRVGAKQHFVGIAKNNTGFMALNRFLSTCLSHKTPMPEQAPNINDCYLVYPLEQVLEINKTQFAPNEYIGVRWQDLNKLRFSGLYHLKEKLVALQTVSFRNKKDYNIHRLFRAIDRNILLSKLSENNCGLPEDKMLSQGEL